MDNITRNKGPVTVRMIWDMVIPCRMCGDTKQPAGVQDGHSTIVFRLSILPELDSQAGVFA
jgi:hypothetical protein